jgi:membrane protein YdbS with pleckstrin-like domain
VLLEPEEETRVAERAYQPPAAPIQEGTSADKIFSISPTLMFVKMGYVLAAVGALLLVAAFSFLAPVVPAWIVVLIGLALFLIPAFYHLRQKLVRYSLTDTTVEIDTGLVSRIRETCPCVGYRM